MKMKRLGIEHIGVTGKFLFSDMKIKAIVRNKIKFFAGDNRFNQSYLIK